jgi:glycosyltransferase involved in cell wall biosynthesis
LALLAIRRSFKSALSRVIALAEKFNRPSNEETLTDFERAKVLSQARQLRPEEINHLKRIYKGSIKTIPLGPLTPEEFDPLPFNDLFEVYLDKLATPDLLVACDLPSLPAAVKFKRSRGCKLLYDAHELYPFQKEFTRRQKLYLAQEEAAALRDVDHVITVSDSIVDYFNQIYGVQATCINNAPSFDSPPDAFRDLVKLPQLDGKVTLLYHGGFSKGRQLLELAQAFKTLAIADVAMVYIGAGELKPALQDLAARTPNLYILDAIPQEAIPALLQSVDLITVSYPALDENTRGAFPNKLGDAIQLGVPIIGNSEMQNLTKICTQYEIGHCGKMNDVESIRQTLSDGITWYKSKSKQDLVRQFEQARSDLGWESQIKKFDKVIQSLFQPPADPGTAKKSVYSQMSF